METVVVISVILSVITLIVFFVMAYRIGKIQEDIRRICKHIAPVNLEHNKLAQREEYKGNKEKAIEHYRNLLFDIEHLVKVKRPLPYWKEQYSKVEQKISELE